MIVFVCLFGSTAASAAPQLKVSENHRFLVYADGRPFFWLGDTAWELFHRLNREEADRYLENRARKGFTVIQAVALAELDGHAVPNAYHLAATRGEDFSYALIYVPAGRAFTVRTGKLSGESLRAWWFDPRRGKAELIDEFAKTETRRFSPPTPGELLDWVLVIDDASKSYPPPGQKRN